MKTRKLILKVVFFGGIIMQINKLREVQLAELNILKEFKKICEQNKLNYYLIGGTALGAVRHKGFIPWDDDIDIGMPRADYVRFVEIYAKELSERYFLQTKDTDTNYMYQFAKIRLNNSTFVQKELKNFNIHHGIFIDIFPLDFIPENNITRIFQKYVCLFFSTIRELKIQKNANVINRKNVIKKVIGYLLSFFPWSFIDRSINWIITKEKRQTKFIANILGCAGYEKEIFSIETFGNPEFIQFEDDMYPVPKEWDLYLRKLYGEYMKIPPLDKRKTHNPLIVSLIQDYREFNV